jgi:hypothetical protein
MLEFSPEFNDVVSSNLRMKSIQLKLILLTAAVFGIVYFIQSFPELRWLFHVFIIAFATLHGLRQTYGLYCAKRLKAATEQTNLAEIRYLKAFTFFAVIAQIFVMTQKKFFICGDSCSSAISYVFSSITFIWIAGVAFYVFRQADPPKKIFWMFLRFLMMSISFVSPIAIYAMLSIHGAEYFDVLNKIKKRSTIQKVGLTYAFILFILFAVICVLELRRYQVSTLGQNASNSVFAAFMISLTLAHYIFDSFAYKMPTSEARQILVRLLH